MSVVSILYTGQSGLSSHGDAIGIVGDNIANANTVGYKGSRANFEDVLARSLGSGGPGDIGMGSRLASVQKILTQGALLGTGVSTDLAIKGDGFFVVKGEVDGLAGNFYTRAGQFHLDADGKLTNDNGLVVQGYGVDAQGNIIKNVTDLQVGTSNIPPSATTAANMVGNLDSNATTPANPFSLTDPTGTSNFSTSMTVYDSLGNAHSVNVFFRQEAAAGTWTWNALVDGGDTTGGTGAGTWESIASGTLTFDTQGRLDTEVNGAASVDFVGATPGQAITFDFGDSITTDGGSGLTGMTNYAGPSTINFMDQDGYASGALTSISIDTDGMISGIFSNGQQQAVGQVLLADFQNAQDLQRTGGNLFVETQKSGAALIGEATQGGRGSINAGALEQSNVDLAKEFVDMIAFQRGFQSSSKTIQTADMLLQEVIGLKR